MYTYWNLVIRAEDSYLHSPKSFEGLYTEVCSSNSSTRKCDRGNRQKEVHRNYRTDDDDVQKRNNVEA